jgi:hypothetical protein
LHHTYHWGTQPDCCTATLKHFLVIEVPRREQKGTKVHRRFLPQKNFTDCPVRAAAAAPQTAFCAAPAHCMDIDTFSTPSAIGRTLPLYTMTTNGTLSHPNVLLFKNEATNGFYMDFKAVETHFTNHAHMLSSQYLLFVSQGTSNIHRTSIECIDDIVITQSHIQHIPFSCP